MHLKNILMSTVTAVAMTATAAFAEITVVNPQKPGGGTTVWTEIIMKELTKHLGERIVYVIFRGQEIFPELINGIMIYVLTIIQS